MARRFPGNRNMGEGRALEAWDGVEKGAECNPWILHGALLALVRSIGFLAMHGWPGSRTCWSSLGLLRVVGAGDARSRMGPRHLDRVRWPLRLGGGGWVDGCCVL